MIDIRNVMLIYKLLKQKKHEFVKFKIVFYKELRIQNIFCDYKIAYAIMTILINDINIDCLLKFENGTSISATKVIQIFGQSRVIHIDTPFKVDKLSFVLHGKPLKITKLVHDLKCIVHVGDLLAENVTLENAYFNVTEYKPIHIADDANGSTEGGYVYVIDGDSGKYLCTLDYLYCICHGIDVNGRNPFSTSSATGTRPLSYAISNGLYWQHIINNGVPRMRQNLYYSDVVGSEYFNRKKSLYTNMQSYVDDYEAYMFGVAMAYVVDEACDEIDSKGRCFKEVHYAELWGEKTSFNTHSFLWSIADKRRHCQMIQTALCLLFTPQIYSMTMQAIDHLSFLLIKDYPDMYNEASAIVNGYKSNRNHFSKSVVYSHVHPFFTESEALKTVLNVDNRCALLKSVESKFLQSITERLDLEKGFKAFSAATDDWLHYFYTPHETMLLKSGVSNKPHENHHGLEFFSETLAPFSDKPNDVYTTYSCGEWVDKDKPRNVSFMLCTKTNRHVLATYSSPLEILNTLLMPILMICESTHHGM